MEAELLPWCNPAELFNLDDDPDELVDLAADPAHKRVREDLLATVLQGNPDQVVAAMERKRQ